MPVKVQGGSEKGFLLRITTLSGLGRLSNILAIGKRNLNPAGYDECAIRSPSFFIFMIFPPLILP